jgi:NTE family protein
MKVGLVFGAGGVQGGAWLTGALDGLVRQTGWDPATATVIAGTSAGSMIGSLVAAGLPPWFMVAHSRGDEFPAMRDARGEPAAEADRDGGSALRIERGALPLLPGSPALVARSLIRPRRHTPAGILAGWLPRGIVSTEPLREIIRRSVPGGWTKHPNHWVIACDYSTGRRVAFGREGAPPASLEAAVAASCAVPGLYRPVRIGDRRYVDGGIWSTSNLDIVRGLGLDLVICLNPTSTLHPIRAVNPMTIFRLLTSRESGRRLGREARRLRDEGTDVVLIQPTDRDLDTMSLNLMSARNRNEVIATAQRTVVDQIAAPEVRAALEALPPGDPEIVRRPERPSEGWPGLEELSSRVPGAA